MFNNSLKKDALHVHEKAVSRYNASYDKMRSACDRLHSARESCLSKITSVELLINSIANTPKDFDKKLGEIKQEVLKFHQTQEYVREAYKSAVKSGVSIVSGVAAGGAVATLAPPAAMSIATTFGVASTGTAIRTLSGAAAKNAALGWIGRVTGGIATKGAITGAGMAAGKAFLALAGPIGWGVSGTSTAVSLISLSNKNKKISEDAIEEAKKIMAARETFDETTAKVEDIERRTNLMTANVNTQLEKAGNYKNRDYPSLENEAQMLLGSLVNNTLSLSALLNETVE